MASTWALCRMCQRTSKTRRFASSPSVSRSLITILFQTPLRAMVALSISEKSSFMYYMPLYWNLVSITVNGRTFCGSTKAQSLISRPCDVPNFHLLQQWRVYLTLYISLRFTVQAQLHLWWFQTLPQILLSTLGSFSNYLEICTPFIETLYKGIRAEDGNGHWKKHFPILWNATLSW